MEHGQAVPRASGLTLAERAPRSYVPLVAGSRQQTPMGKQKPARSEDGIFAYPFVRSISLLREQVPSFDEYPFSVPAIAALDELEFHRQVTFLVGENGSG